MFKSATMIADKVKLLTICDGTRFDYVEPSLACAAQHALSILEHEEGCLLAIEVNGQNVWSFDPEQPKKSCALIEGLAQKECVS